MDAYMDAAWCHVYWRTSTHISHERACRNPVFLEEAKCDDVHWHARAYHMLLQSATTHSGLCDQDVRAQILLIIVTDSHNAHSMNAFVTES